MESEQKPKEIKVEFSCEVKELPPTKKEQRQDRRAKKVSKFCGYSSLFCFVVGMYFIFTTTSWYAGRFMLATLILGLSFLLFIASSIASSYKEIKNAKDFFSGESSFNDYNYL